MQLNFTAHPRASEDAGTQAAGADPSAGVFWNTPAGAPQPPQAHAIGWQAHQPSEEADRAALALYPAEYPMYLLSPDRWDVTDAANRQPGESDTRWRLRGMVAAVHWADQDARREAQAGPTPRAKAGPTPRAKASKEDAAEIARMKNREAQARFRARQRGEAEPAHAPRGRPAVVVSEAVQAARAAVEAAKAQRAAALAQWDAHIAGLVAAVAAAKAADLLAAAAPPQG